ncbi:MAG: hypothetical protein IKU82_00945 [Clostridia bacterium]|nr:hypothetical protein [Clostridia bacterium]
MTRLFKNSKQVLAFVFAFAVLAVSLFTGSIAIEADACDVSKIDYWDGTKASSFASGTGTEADPYIIKTAEQLAYCCTGINAANSTGKFYKVDDSVKIFVMQPESVVDLQTLLALDSAEATKDYLAGLSGKKDWSSLGASGFNGNFDGNGVTIYGIWADGLTTNKSDVGLFPRYDGGYKDGNGNVVGNVCKNVAVRNSYFTSTRRIGVISGASWGPNYDGKINGIVYYDTIAVVNCYLSAVGSINYYGEQGIVVDGGAEDVSILSNILVRGNYAYNTEQNKNMGVLAASNNNGVMDDSGKLVKASITNAIILGSDPFRREYYSDPVFYNAKDENGNTVRTFFNNVITDMPAGKVTATNPSGWGTASTTAEFAETNVKQVTDTGFAFQAAASNLDWENTWFMSENGPELRAFHGAISSTIDAETHVWECEDCGLKSAGGVADHEWVEESAGVFECSVCDYKCLHNSLNTYDDPGDCVTDPGTYTVCEYCNYTTVIPTNTAPGHDLTYVPADPGHCEKEGHTEYWYCEECENKFTSDDVMAPMSAAVTDADLSTGLGTHLKDKDGEGNYIVMYDENGHWFVCSIDNGRIDHDSNALADDEVEKHNYSNAVCIDCGYECKDHDYELTGKMAVSGDCYTDEEMEIKCNICGNKSTVVSDPAGHDIVKVDEVPANDRMEGTKAHYTCETCHLIYSDAEGKVPVTKAALVIPKVLPAGYETPPTIGNENTDTSGKSPSTGDNLASVVAMATLAGAAIVFARKVR